jgi:membrane associated rhomboid family serine protease
MRAAIMDGALAAGKRSAPKHGRREWMIGPTTVVRARTSRRAEELALVLASAGITHRLVRAPTTWRVVVGEHDAERAAAALSSYRREVAASRPRALPPEHGPTSAGLVMGALLFAVYIATGSRAAATPAFLAGSARADAILRGELWRVVTALTLHADGLHLIANVVFGVLLATAVCRLLGPGLGAWMLLAAGAGGNLVNALVRGPEYDGVGASTAILGAVGILAGLAAARSPQRAWIPVGAGLALLALLGSGAHTDLGAHLFGFAVGVGLGILAAVFVPRPPALRAQRLLAVGALGAVATCWLVALR